MKLTEDNISRITKAFNSIDKDRDGFISEKELLKFLKETFPELNAVETDALKCDILAFCDQDGDGFLNLQEFTDTFSKDMGIFNSAVQKFARKLTKAEVEKLKATFAQVDKNKDGILDSSELRELLATAFPTASWETLDDLQAMILSVVDKNADGRLSLTEFIRSFALEQGVLPSEVAKKRAKTLAKKLTKDEVEQLKRTFQMIDLDHDGFIAEEELLALLDVTFRAPKEVLEEAKNVILAAADKNKDGRLNMTEFIRSFALQQGVLPAMVVQDRAQGLYAKLTEAEIHQLQQTFREIDDNKDDFIDAEELTTLLTAAFPGVPADILLDTRNTILATADKNSDGKININEFIRTFQEGQGVLPWHVPESTKHRMEAMKRERENKREIMHHEPMLRDEMKNLSQLKQEGEAVRSMTQSPLLENFNKVSKNDVSGALIAEDQLRAEFDKWDTNNNGFLSKQEFSAVYKDNYDLFGEMTEKKINDMLAKYNMLGDDRISYQEFAIIMLKLAQK